MNIEFPQIGIGGIIVGAIACTTIIPAIESALTSIFCSGQMFLRIGQYSYTKCTFQTTQPFTSAKDYHQAIGNDFFQIIDESIRDSKLPSSCKVKSNEPIINLRFKENSYQFDLESLEQHCGLFRFYPKEFGPVLEISIPSNFSEKSFYHLQTYLEAKTDFDNQTITLFNVDESELLELYELAAYLEIPDLEVRCMRIVVRNIIDSGLTDLDRYRNLIDLNLYGEEFKLLITKIKQFKVDYYEKKLDIRLLKLMGAALEAGIGVYVNSLKVLGLSYCSIIPLIGPPVAHRLFLDGNSSLMTVRWLHGNFE